ncbi:MAG: Protein kinase [Myxococcales bacterium]|nr:Protein kinase [Myxococcales bacterium]
MAQTANVGETLLGKYRVEEVIGIGGMGRVVRAMHLYLNQPVAIKILLPNMAESASTVQRFLREAQATVKLRSEHIARVMDVGTLPDNTPFMVMEFLEGYDLNQILRHHGPQMPMAVVDLMVQACEGMAEAHALGIIHRDIKPSNFFITRRPDGSNLLKILDFGISKTPAELTELTGTQTVIGTPTYMAPEQMRTARSTDPRSDVWSMGVVMYQMLAGRPPFEAETYAELVLKVGVEPPTPLHIQLPPGLGQVIMSCLEKDPKSRMQSVGDLARSLAPFASDPLSAQQSAERATRILATQRGDRPGFTPGGLGGMGSAQGLTPPALTPKSWHHTNGSSLSGGAGQISAKPMSNRGLVIGCVAALVVLAGAGGFIASNLIRKGDRSDAHVVAPEPAKAPEPIDTVKTEPPKTEPPKTELPKVATPEVTKVDTKTEPAKIDPPNVTKTEFPKLPKLTKTETPKVTKTETPKVTKTEPKATKTETPKVTKTETPKVIKTDSSKAKGHKDKPADDLFNDRH